MAGLLFLILSTNKERSPDRVAGPVVENTMEP